jgi:hypothetical protein
MTPVRVLRENNKDKNHEKNYEYNANRYKKFRFCPVAIYHNASTDKLKIIKENRGKSGVYRWTHLNSNKCYIGSSIDLSRRFRDYLNNILHDLRKNMAINKALLKYGYSQFKLEILEYCDIKDIVKREQYYIDYFNPDGRPTLP